MTETYDDLADRPAADGCPGGCEHGWRTVHPHYARQEANGDPLKEAALLNSVYPCKVCNPVAFFRWAGGHFRADHDTGACPDCVEERHGKAAANRLQRRLEGDDSTRRAEQAVS